MRGTPDLHLAFDVGHSSIGWAVLKAASQQVPELLGCGSVIFPADDCLAAQRRGFRRQRRHIRATRLRIARLRRLLAHLGVLTTEQLEAPGCAWPWLLAARVLCGGKTLSWPELWDVLRWYAHNRGYDGNKGWSRHEADSADDEDTEKEKRAGELLDDFRKRHGRRGTMAEVFCDVLKVDPLGPVKSSMERVRGLGAAFPREGVEAEVERVLRAHLGGLQQVDERLIEALMRDNTALPGPDLRLPKRYGQRVNGVRTPGGLLFGQLVPRFENRIIATCPIMYQRVYESEFAATGDAERARHEAEKLAKVPGADCNEFRRFRWAMQVVNIQVATDDPRQPRRLSVAERGEIDKLMRERGALTVTELKKAVRAITGAKDNLDQMLVHPDAAKALVLDPAQELVSSGGFAVIWQYLDGPARAHTKTNLRRGKSVTLRALLAAAPAEAAFSKWFDGESLKKRKNPLVRDEVLDEPHRIRPESGRAPYTRQVMSEACEEVFQSGIHPADEGGVLFRSEAIRNAQLRRALDEQTNNHLVRHRLKLLERLHADLLKAYADDDKTRIARVTIEVNRDIKEFSGKTAQEQAKDLGQRLANFKSVVKKLEADFEGKNIHITPGLIRKARIAEDLGWACPYTGKAYDAFDLLHRRVDKDHVVPRSDRSSDSLDSLVITFAEVNKMKGRRTAALFVEECQSQPVPGLPNVAVKPLAVYLKYVAGLETFKGHDDDQRRKKRRKQLLALRDYVEKEFVPRDLTQTSQLVRLGAQALQKHYLGDAQAPVIISLPGSVTGAVRKSWKLAGCLGLANPQIFDEEGEPRTKADIRGITHLHHALDACVLAFASLFLPRDGGAWELLVKRRLSPDEQRRARACFGSHIEISKDGELRLPDLPSQYKEQIRACLAERRVVQHVPADPSGLECKETVWRVFDATDRHHSTRRLGRWLEQAKIAVPASDARTALIVCRKRKSTAETESTGGKVLRETKIWLWVFDIKDKSALLGLEPDGDPAQAKLKKLKAVKVLGDNFGLALDPQPTLIRPHKVWPQLQSLRSANGGKPVRVLRKGILVRVPKRGIRPKYEGVWMVRGVTLNQRAGFLVDMSPSDQIIYRRHPGCLENVSVATLLRCGLEVLRAPLSGVPPLPKQAEGYDVPGISDC